ncbi:hypothetical protein RN001_006636 [Aquatica leii]|uniref:Regulatory protein zeste n=1 Tax=Aquatica leii TaxID=1421715 RepID=A0AAN7PDT1_9COLE|nr:hypothetical protein RN001_006636 [Aquatica leii]
MENSRIRGKNFSENEKNVLFDLVTSKYSDIIDNKKTDGVTLAKKKLAWEEIAVNFNCQNQNGNRSAKQLHDLYDNLKRTARVNLQCDKEGDAAPPENVPAEEAMQILESENVENTSNDPIDENADMEPSLEPAL